MINSIFNDVTSNIEILSILMYSFVSIILGFFIAITHKITTRSNKNLFITITLLPFLVATIIMMVNGNLGTSVAILGAFSLVRFRSYPGTSKEILSVFFAMTVGLAAGVGHLVFASIITFIGCLVLLILGKIKLLDIDQNEKILKIILPEDLDYEDIFDEIFNKYTRKCQLEQVKTINMGSLFELKYRIIMKSNVSQKAFLDDLRIRNGNLKIVLSKSLDEGEL